MILVLPWICVPIQGVLEQFRMPKAVFFDISCFVIIAIGFIEGLKFQYKNKYLGWFLLYCLIGIFFNWYSPLIMSFNGGLQFNLWTIENMLHFILGTAATLVICSYIERDDFIRIAKAFCISATLISIIGIMQFINIQPFPKVLNFTAGIHVSAFLDNPNLVGNYLCLCMPFFFYLNKPKYWAMFLLTCLCLYFTESDISQVCAVIGIFSYILFTARNRKLNIIVGLILIAFLTYAYFNPQIVNLEHRFAGRMQVWWHGWDYFKQNPLFGNGMGIWKTYNVFERGVFWYEAHNDWLERIIELGLVGIFFFILVIIHSLRNFNYSKDNKLGFAYLSSFITFLILAGGTFIMETAPVMLIGLIGFWGVERLRE